MEEHDAGGGFVDVLTAVTARTHKRLFQISLAHIQSGHAARQFVLFVKADRERAHSGNDREGVRPGQVLEPDKWVTVICPFF
jgi:predicted DNA-binding protein (MmcQ/YjbR family)